METSRMQGAALEREEFQVEVAAGRRYEFGKNWQRFLGGLSEARIAAAECALAQMLGVTTLAGRSFLDVGSGSGLSSLAALRLGAARVHSFDYDPLSVACTRELKRRYAVGLAQWTAEPGSALDAGYLATLGQWDIVYAWGVLHHTGAMWTALDNVAALVRPGGLLFISIYNDQGGLSRYWRLVKRMYNGNRLVRALITAGYVPYYVLGAAAVDLTRRRNPARRYRDAGRGMNFVRDWFDWLGGLPFEVARPDHIFGFYRARGFVLERLKTSGGGLGCNEFVFRKA